METISNSALVEIKLYVNEKLYVKGVITEEMYIRAKEIIINA